MKKNEARICDGGRRLHWLGGLPDARRCTRRHRHKRDKLTYAANLRSLDSIADSPRYVFEQADICNRRALDALFAHYQPTGVIDLAAEITLIAPSPMPEHFEDKRRRHLPSFGSSTKLLRRSRPRAAIAIPVRACINRRSLWLACRRRSL